MGTPSPQSGVPAESLLNRLSYSHLELAVDLDDEPKRDFYVAECLRAVPVATLEAAQAKGGTNSPIVNGTTLTGDLSFLAGTDVYLENNATFTGSRSVGFPWRLRRLSQ